MAGPVAAAAALRIGDQLILEEDYDEAYIPSQREIQEFARVIGIDPEAEPELLWLAREGIVAPLPAEWKPCQDVTGDIYYFNFATGQSSWDHPCDERYRQLVAQERERRLDPGGGGGGGGGLQKRPGKQRKKDKRKKKGEEILLLKREVQSESGLLPSASFYRTLSPASSSGRASPDLEPQGSLTARQEPFLRGPKGRSSAVPLEPSDPLRLLPAGASGKLQPLSLAKPSRTHQILADVEKILGRASSSAGRHDAGHPPRQDAATEVRCAAAGVFSDSELEDTESPRGAQRHFRTLKEPLRGAPADDHSLGTESPPRGGLLLEVVTLGKEQGDISALEGHSPVDALSGERDGSLRPAVAAEVPTARSAASLQPSSAQDEDGVSHSLGNGLRLLDGRRRKGLPEQRHATELDRSGGEAGEQGAAPVAVPGLRVEAEAGAQASPEPFPSTKVDSGGGSVGSSLVDHLASQVLGEVDNFSWDLQSSHDTDRPADPAAKRPFLQALHSQTHSSSEDLSESECFSEDQKFHQHMLHMVKRSRRVKHPLAKPFSQSPGAAQEDSREAVVSGTGSPRGPLSAAKEPEEREPSLAEKGSRTAFAPQGEKGEEPDSCRRGVCESVAQEKAAEAASALDLLLSDNSVEKEDDSISEGPRRGARLLRNLHVDVSALGSGSDDEGEVWLPGDEVKLTEGGVEEGRSQGNAESEAKPMMPRKEEGSAEDKVEDASAGKGQALSLQHAKQAAIQRFPEQLRQEEEEETQGFHQQKEEALQSLKCELENARREEERSLREKALQELEALRTQICSETEAEKERLREELESLRRSEEQALREEARLSLERMKREAEAAQEAQEAELEQDLQKAVSERKERLCQEKEAALQQLEAQFAVETELQRVAAQEVHEKALSALQRQIAEAQQKAEAELQEELECAEQQVQRKRHQVAEYDRELSDLLREKRQEVERDHTKRLEKVQEAHREALAEIQVQHQEEERRRREELQSQLQEEREHLRASHEAEVEALRRKHAEQLRDLCRSQKEEEEKTALEREFRVQEAQAKAAQLQAQEEAWKRRKQQLLEEEKQLEQQRKEVALALEESRKEQESLAETVRRLLQEVAEIQKQKAVLGSQVEQLRKEASELEEAAKGKQGLLSPGEGGSPKPSPKEEEEEELRLEDLQDSSSVASPREMECKAPKDNEESNGLLDQVRHYISAEGSSLKTTKEFLVRQTHSMRKRQTVLRAAKQHWSHDLQDPGRSQVLEGVRRSLEEEARQLEEVRSAVRKGQALLRKKEERLAQLESSLMEELSDEDTLKGGACKKVVTFDLSDSEDTSSLMSGNGSSHKTLGLKPELRLPPLDKIQCLTDSLQRITSELNRVLGLLSTFSAQQPLPIAPGRGPASPLPKEGAPLAAYPSLPRTSAGPHWAWGICSAPAAPSFAPAGQSVDNMLTEKWRKYFPGVFPLPRGGPGALSGKLSLVTPDDPLRLFPQPPFRGSEAEKQNIQGMIDANRKWLESVKQDSRAPLLPSGHKSPLGAHPGVVQLGLDENNQIKAYHF
ncbi:centrosomal protein of 164 kDa isoform X2 [Anolis sagrei]|uniref:centrosomal protein of 164 kDa isoform X2 n=1 Tax=Anolis sagrei TaxID=38937 RepID=UPI0035209F88